jgi:diaminopimelate epimerase
MEIPFEKMHGLGNDFVVVRADALGGRDVGALVARWCERRRGIGADGVLVVSDETEEGFAMRVHNRDGSIPEICGNGIRCAVLSWAARRGLVEGEVVVGTGAGPKRCRWAGGEVTVEMGPARLEAPHLPPASTSGARLARVAVTVAGAEREGLAVSMGNPHLVLFAEHWPAIAAEEARLLEHHPGFPERANVSFATEPREGRSRVTVFERGVGFTQACGSAACATAVAAVASGRLGGVGQARLSVELPGGVLVVEVGEELERVAMTGPATRVYAGAIEVGH